MNQHRLLLIDPYPVVRRALAARLALIPTLVLVGETSDVAEGMRLAEQLQPDLILLEPKQLDAAQVTRCLHALAPQAHILAYTSYLDGSERAALLAAGASAYLLKSFDLAGLWPWLNSGRPGTCPASRPSLS